MTPARRSSYYLEHNNNNILSNVNTNLDGNGATKNIWPLTTEKYFSKLCTCNGRRQRGYLWMECDVTMQKCLHSSYHHVAKNTVTVCCYYRVVCGDFVLQTCCVFWSGIPDYTSLDPIALGRVLFMTTMLRCILIASWDERCFGKYSEHQMFDCGQKHAQVVSMSTFWLFSWYVYLSPFPRHYWRRLDQDIGYIEKRYTQNNRKKGDMDVIRYERYGDSLGFTQ